VLDRLRLDKWLWQARFFKTRASAQSVVEAGHVRINSEKVAKSSREVKSGDVLTFPQAGRIRVIKVLAMPIRRGPSEEALTLYADLDAPSSQNGTNSIPTA
jgi:ribosome-associated heat shock protein Hsp15